jgi:hypothetical protein
MILKSPDSYFQMKSESKRILIEIQKKAINPVTHKPFFRASDEVLKEAAEPLQARDAAEFFCWPFHCGYS